MQTFQNDTETRQGAGCWRGQVVARLANDRGRVFVACVVMPGERYGLEGACYARLTLVEFYDATYAGKRGFADVGQFVARYLLDSLMSDEYAPAAIAGGIALVGHVPEWTLTADNVREAVSAALALQPT